MARIAVGQLVVHRRRCEGWSVREPISRVYVAWNFGTRQAAVAAAREMDEIADWWGIVKLVARGEKPNCGGVVLAIIERHGGNRVGPSAGVRAHCARVVAQREPSPEARARAEAAGLGPLFERSA